MEENSTCTIENCDIFDFMANYVGLSVLHPGGLKATEKLASDLRINKNTKIIDIACGKGTTAIFLAQNYKCQVVGVDISADLIEYAKKLAREKGLDKLVSFQVGDAQNLPFADGEFDTAISQAMLILVENKIKAIQEAVRVIKPGGLAGWIELSWKQPPNDQFMHDVTDELCAYCMENVSTFDDWEKIFRDAGVMTIEIQKNSMEFNGMKGMISDEGFRNSMNVMLSYIGNSRIRNRMKKLSNFILSNPQYFGYGIYICKKD
jgi:ubiquinone/menaquinone biosynthesis C-methylase UbiE